MVSRGNVILSLGVIVGLSIPALADGPSADFTKPAAADAKQAAATRVLITIAKETTVITKPLRKDGYPDYVAALNEFDAMGVTPENNAAVLLWSAIGPAPMVEADRANYFGLLGMPVPPEIGDYFVESDAFVRQQSTTVKSRADRVSAELARIEHQHWIATHRAWSARECRLLATWLDTNARPLDLAAKASRRSKLFDPLIVHGDNLLLAAPVHLAQFEYHLATALVERATLRLGDGKSAAAWQDLLAAHRMARLCGLGATLAEGLLACNIDEIACRGDQALLRSATLSAADAQRMRADLLKLTALPSMAEKIDQEERFGFLDCVVYASRHGLLGWGRDLIWEEKRPLNVGESILNMFSAIALDWDVILRMGNNWYDRVLAAYGEPTAPRQRIALAAIDRDIDAIMHPAKKWQPRSLATLRRDLTDRFGRDFVALLVPAVTKAADIEHSAAMRFELDKLAFSLAAFHADHGSYPAKLGELVPKYAEAMPEDVFIAGDFHYKPDGDDYLLYSVGPNGNDDGGRERDDDKGGAGWDDIVVRVRKAP